MSAFKIGLHEAEVAGASEQENMSNAGKPAAAEETDRYTYL